jgi:hypothetical protein
MGEPEWDLHVDDGYLRPPSGPAVSPLAGTLRLPGRNAGTLAVPR